MDPVTMFMIGCAVVTITFTAAAWLFNQATEGEQSRQNSLRGELDEVRGQTGREARDYFENQRGILHQHVGKLLQSKESVEPDLKNLRSFIQRELGKSSISIYQQRALQTADRRTADAIWRLQAYKRYLTWYKGQLTNIAKTERYDKIVGIALPMELLPDDHPHVGKCILLSHDEVKKFGNGRGPFDFHLRLDDPDLEESFKDEVPVLITGFRTFNGISEDEQYRGIHWGSIARGSLYVDYLNGDQGAQVEVECLQDSPKGAQVMFQRQVKMILPRENKLSPLKRYAPREPIQVYPLNWDLLLNRITVSERRPVFVVPDIARVPFVYQPGRISEDALDALGAQRSLIFSPQGNIPQATELTVQAGSKRLLLEKKTDRVNVLKEIPGPMRPGIMAEFSFPIDVIPESVYDPALGIDNAETLSCFYQAIEKEFEYQEYLANQTVEQKNVREFFDKWSAIVDHQIANNEYEPLATGRFTQALPSESDPRVMVVSLDRKTGQELFKVIKRLETPELESGLQSLLLFHNIELWASFRMKGIGDDAVEPDPYRLLRIGRLMDFNGTVPCAHLQVDGDARRALDGLEWEPGNACELRLKLSTAAYFQQREALRRFKNNQMVSGELKRVLVAPALLRKEQDPGWPPDLLESLAPQNDRLTENQWSAVKAALGSKDVFMIQGPPGTGKTTVIKELVYQYLMRSPRSKVLIVAQQNVAVDNALEGIYRANQSDWFERNDGERRTMIRCGREEKIDSDIIKECTIDRWFERYRDGVVKHNIARDDYGPLRRQWIGEVDHKNLRDVDPEILQTLLKTHQIVGATCVGLAGKRIGLDLLEFDLTIIDEAGRATPPELLIPLLRSRKVVIIGDHYQLPPTVKLDDADLEILGVTRDFLTESMFKTMYEQLPHSKTVLCDQFRMPNTIGNIVGSLFYADVEPKLRNGRDKKPDDSFIFRDEIIWIDVANGKGQLLKTGRSRFNKEEGEAVRRLVEYIDATAIARGIRKSVAIITPYAAQKQLLRDLIGRGRWNALELKIDTIDSFQGKEADVVIYSAARTEGRRDFLIDKHRLNVAISRTRENLIIVANLKHISAPLMTGERGDTNYFAAILTHCKVEPFPRRNSASL